MKTAIMTMGLPGAGKSHVLAMSYNVSEYTVIDPDAIKMEKADYDAKNPGVYHEWSSKEAKFRTAVAINNNENLIIDGTGTNVESMYKKIKNLQANGYMVTLLYVKVRLQTSLRRNAERARTVPESLIYEKFSTITEAFEILSSLVDEIKVVDND